MCEVSMKRDHMSDPTNFLVKALAAIVKPIIKEAVREAMGGYGERTKPSATNEKAIMTVKQDAEISGLGASTIRLAIRRRQLRAQKVGRRVLVKRSDLESFLEASPIAAMPRQCACQKAV